MFKCYFIAVALMALAVMLSIVSNIRKWKSVTPFRIIIGGCFLSVWVLLLPLIKYICPSDLCVNGRLSWWMTSILALHNSLKAFSPGVAAGDILTAIRKGLPGFPPYLYTMGILLGLCPVLALGFIISFVHEASSWIRLRLSFRSDRYIFSELNEKSLALARDIQKENRKKVTIIFTDVFKKNEETSYELREEARKIGAICFKRDIVTLNIRPHSAGAKVCLFAIGENEAENVEQAISLIDYYKNINNVELYVFSTRIDGELILTKADKGKIKVHRINATRSFIYTLLKELGKEKLFDTAKSEQNGAKKISAVVVGMGLHGTEMLKALAWYCQMDGYHIEINAFDKDKDAESKFAAKAPDLLSPEYNGKSVRGEAKYTIRIHPGIDVYTAEFYNEIKKITDATYAFVSIGSDEDNIRAAAELRMLFERMGIKPVIQTVVFNSKFKDALSGETPFNSGDSEIPVKGAFNHKGQPYDIDFVGDLNRTYSCESIFKTDIEGAAEKRHGRTHKPAFWQYEYNYNSSIASQIHQELRSALLEGDAEAEAETEHCRWNAYMRGEGYVFSGSPDKKSRNDLGKMHPDLIPYHQLPTEEQAKDKIRV